MTRDVDTEERYRPLEAHGLEFIEWMNDRLDLHLSRVFNRRYQDLPDVVHACDECTGVHRP